MARATKRSTNRSREEEVLIWAGVVAQLNRTRSNQLLGGTSVPYALFVLLRHFSHDVSREWSVTQLTAAFETSQSGMTKKLQKLLSFGLIDSRPDVQDGRKKWFCINKDGRDRLRDMNKMLSRDQLEIFETWSSADIDKLHSLLFRLKSYLDDNRR